MRCSPRRLGARLLPLLNAVLLPITAACTGEGPGSEDTIRIGLLTDLSGQFSSFGQDVRSAVDLAVEEINSAGGIDGSRIELLVRDTAGEPDEAALAARELATTDEVFVLVGPITSAEAEVVFLQASRLHVPALTGSVTVEGLTELGEGWAFRNQATNTQFFEASMRVFVDEYGVTGVALVVDETLVFTAAAADVLPPIAAENGVEIAEVIPIQSGQTDFASVVQRIGASEVNGLLVMSAATEGGLLARELDRQGIQLPVLGHPAHNSASFHAAGGDTIADWVLPSIFETGAAGGRAAAYADEMRQRDHDPPTQPEAANYYDIVYMIAAAARDAGVSSDSSLEEARAALRDGLSALEAFEGLGGPISFLSNGDTEKHVYTIVLDGDGSRTLE